MNNIITRFAPSPTGYLHIGGARTALFNWLYARNTKGKFILRIEDTDQTRSNKIYTQAIIEALKWLKIDWDDGPYFQSKRLEIYQHYLKYLLSIGQAYYCNCSQNDIDLMRKKAISIGKNPKYNGKCRNKNVKYAKNNVIRFKSPNIGKTIVNDIIKKKIEFKNNQQDDFIICRSNGTPTYNFAAVIDDITMGINTVIRGNDHITNTPKQVMIYNSLMQPLPIFCHIPMVLGTDKIRLSKRNNATSVISYKNDGYLPDAFMNCIARLGWSHGNQEFFTKEDLINKFNIKNIGKSASIFDPKKLIALNAEHIKQTNDKELGNMLIPFINKQGYKIKNKQYIDKVVFTLKKRSKTLEEMSKKANFYFEEISPSNNKKIYNKFLTTNMITTLSDLLLEFQNIKKINKENLENAFKNTIKKNNTTFSEIAQLTRIILTGSTTSPGILEMLEVLGKKTVLTRLNTGLEFMLEYTQK